MTDKKYPVISHERLVKIFEKATPQEQLAALNELRDFVAANLAAERDEYERKMQELNLSINTLKGNI